MILLALVTALCSIMCLTNFTPACGHYLHQIRYLYADGLVSSMDGYVGCTVSLLEVGSYEVGSCSLWLEINEKVSCDLILNSCGMTR